MPRDFMDHSVAPEATTQPTQDELAAKTKGKEGKEADPVWLIDLGQKPVLHNG